MDQDFKFFAKHFNNEIKVSLNQEFSLSNMNEDQLMQLQKEEQVEPQIIKNQFSILNLNYIMEGTISDMSFIQLSNGISLIAIISLNRVAFYSIIVNQQHKDFNQKYDLKLMEVIQIQYAEPENPERQIPYLFQELKSDIIQENLICGKFGIQKTQQDQSNVVLICGGLIGQLYIIYVNSDWKIDLLQGHVSEIRDIQYPPKNQNYDNSNLVLTCSKDSSIILFNFNLLQKVAVFLPQQNLDGEFIKIAWSLDGLYIISSTTENQFQMYKINEDIIKNENNNKKYIKIKRNVYQTQQPHSHANCFVIDLAFYGFSIISKDQRGNIVHWVIDNKEEKGSIILKTIKLSQEEISQNCFELINELGLLLIGDKAGQINGYILNQEINEHQIYKTKRQPDFIISLDNVGFIKKCFVDALEYNFIIAISNDKDLILIDLNEWNILKALKLSNSFLQPRNLIQRIFNSQKI